jgi:type III secretory pathway component EscT
MTEIMIRDTIEKILFIYRDKLESSFYSIPVKNKINLFLTIAYENKIFHKEFIESYNTKDELNNAVKLLSDTFPTIIYKGDLIDEVKM